MATLKDTAMNYSGRKELSDLESIPVDIEVKTDKFTGKDGKEYPFSFIEVGGWKYTLKAKDLDKIKQIVQVRPTTKHIKFQKDGQGGFFVIPLD